MIAITKIVKFCAGHRYWRPDWSEQRNREMFGKCANAPGHGHNYTLEVTLRGAPDPQTGMIMDLKEVKEILEERLLRPLDHCFLNEAVPRFREQVPTPENLLLHIRELLDGAFPGCRLHRLRLWEADDLGVEWEEEPRCSG